MKEEQEGGMERGRLIGTGEQLDRKNNILLYSTTGYKVYTTDCFKTTSREDFECSQHKEMLNV
jgi:hypothetical protein